MEARDADLGLNGEVRYGLLADGLDSHFFTIDPDTGELSAAFTADREVKDVYTVSYGPLHSLRYLCPRWLRVNELW